MDDNTGTKARLDTLLRDFEALRPQLVGYPCNQALRLLGSAAVPEPVEGNDR